MNKHDYLKVSDYEIGLTLLLNKKVKEVRGYLSWKYDEPTFELTKIEFEDGTMLGVEGEHDFPYLVTWGRPGASEYCKEYADDEKLQEIYDEQNKE